MLFVTIHLSFSFPKIIRVRGNHLNWFIRIYVILHQEFTANTQMLKMPKCKDSWDAECWKYSVWLWNCVNCEHRKGHYFMNVAIQDNASHVLADINNRWWTTHPIYHDCMIHCKYVASDIDEMTRSNCSPCAMRFHLILFFYLSFLTVWLSVRLDFMNLTKPGDTNVCMNFVLSSFCVCKRMWNKTVAFNFRSIISFFAE